MLSKFFKIVQIFQGGNFMELKTVRSMIYGHAIGDALGVPVEFKKREVLDADPVVGMRAFGTFDMPDGTWSDDTSMVLATMESLGRIGKIDYTDIMTNFLRWAEDDEFTFDGMFDIGLTTADAIRRFSKGTPAQLCGNASERGNGNGSLMRMAPIALYLHDKYGSDLANENTIRIICNISSLTHAHTRTFIACSIFVLIANEILNGNTEIKSAVNAGLKKATDFFSTNEDFKDEFKEHYDRLISPDFIDTPRDQIRSSGYVVDTIEAAVWCLLNSDNYADCVLLAVNLGGDTDTIAAIAGGIAGLVYGEDMIPDKWVATLLGRSSIDYICELFANQTYQNK